MHRVPSPCSVLWGEPTIGTVQSTSGTATAALRLWLPAVLWAALIFGFSSVPDLGTGLGGWDLVLRKLAHTVEYAILGLLLVRALRRELPALVLGVAYASSDELHQHFVPGRRGAPLDVLIDAVGVALGILAWRLLALRRDR